MEQPKKNPQEIQIELTPEVASGHYANLAAITHTPGEVFIDFIALTPNMPKAKVQSRIKIGRASCRERVCQYV